MEGGEVVSEILGVGHEILNVHGSEVLVKLDLDNALNPLAGVVDVGHLK